MQKKWKLKGKKFFIYFRIKLKKLFKKVYKMRRINSAVYAMILTNYYGLKLKLTKNKKKKKQLRINYSKKLLDFLKIEVAVKNAHKIPKKGQYLVIVNHRGIIDPLIVEIALQESEIFGLWIAKKELYNSPFFGLFVRNAGAIRVDRGKAQMSGFFAEVKEGVKDLSSIFIFPEGTRNKTTKELLEFKEGFRLIALKNRLDILPLYIRSNTAELLKNAIKNQRFQKAIIEVGDIISFRERGNIQKMYEAMFAIT